MKVRLFRLLKNNIFVFCFCFLYVLVLLMVFNHCYLVNDDMAILFDIQGGFPTSYMGVLLGKVLSFFYLHISQSIPWYGLFLYFIHIISLFLFIKSLAKIEKFKSFFLPFVLAYLSFYAFFIVAVSYNNASIMIGANSLFAFLIYLTYSKNQKKRALIIAFLLGFLFSFSYLIRMEVLTAILLFSLPVLLFFLFSNLKKYRYFIAFTAPIILLISLNLLVSNYFVSGQYKQFRGFRQLLGRIDVGPKYSEQNNQKILEANNWTKNDYIMMLQWSFFNEKKYNKETLENVLKYFPPKASPLERKNFDSYYESSQTVYKTYKLDLFFLLFIILLSLFFSRFKTLLILFSYLIYSSVGIIYMWTFVRFPTRIGDPLFLLIIGMSLALIFSNSENFNRQWQNLRIKYFLGALLSILIILNILRMDQYRIEFPIQISIKDEVGKINRDINKLNTEYPQDIFLIPAWNLHVEFLDPLKTPAFKFKKLEGGWPIFSPRFYENLEEILGVKYAYEMVPAIIDNDKVFIIASDSFLPIFSTYIKENYNLNVALVKVDSLSGSNIYKIISQ